MIAKSIQHDIQHDDIELLANILEQEKRHHCRMRSVCLALFLFSFVLLLMAFGTIAFLFAAEMDFVSENKWLTLLQFVAPVSAAMIWFFASWWAAQNCINSIDRSLYAAHAGRLRLFAGFVGELQCASKEKRSLWMDMIGSVIA